MIVLCQNDPEIRAQIEQMSLQPDCRIEFVLDGAGNWILTMDILDSEDFQYMRQFIIDNTIEIEYTPPIEG